ncbi:MAG: tRNA pseudouridine(38-40) synthase TruA [Nitrospirae bacterium]|nr:tRNA pseudouridine(38-40) synthase TruA [Nitrospirota bacterium]
MKRVKLKLCYDGSGFSGWQIQPDAVTVQGVLEEAIERVTGQRSRVTGASRTDAGVHALEQVAVFDTESALPPLVIVRALNANIPVQVRVLEASYVDGDFHPRFSARGKIYVYIIENSQIRSPFLVNYAYHNPRKLHVDAMKEAASYLIGRHDFKSFQGSGCSARTTIRDLRKLDIQIVSEVGFGPVRLTGRFILFEFEADAFLRYMVRNMVGTLVEVGLGKLRPVDIKEILRACDRTRSGPTAPGQGLYLKKILY